MKANEAILKFDLRGKPDSCEPYGNGHINETYKVVTSKDSWYILQKISGSAFKDPDGLMRNISLVTAHLNKKTQDPRSVLTLIPTMDGASFFKAEDGSCWRVYDFVRDSICFETAESPEIFYASAMAFGDFQRMLSDFPAKELTETIPFFHHTVKRFEALDKAIQADPFGLTAKVEPEISFALSQRKFASTLIDLLNANQIPTRVTHNDTKLNNVLFDKDTKKGICVIDLDTVMPGLVVNDFGDSIRFGAVHAAEDEKDLSKMWLDTDLFATYAKGFLKACGQNLEKIEIEMMPVGAKMMTLECGIRFLTDYLVGNTYFHIRYPDQNLDRTRTQFKLVADMDKKWDEMNEIIQAIAAHS